MYEQELINVLSTKVKELEKKVLILEEKHWSECGQIARYDDDVRALKSGYFQLLDENVALRMWIRDHFNGDIKATSCAIDEAMQKKIDSI